MARKVSTTSAAAMPTKQPPERAAPKEWAKGLTSAQLTSIYEYFDGMDVSRPHVVASGAIVRAAKVLIAKQEAVLAQLDLTVPRFELLGYLSQAPEGRLSLKELGRASLVHPATLTYTVDALQKRGWVKREQDPSDRRLVIAQLTAKGRKVIASAIPLLQGIEFGLADLSERDAATVSVLLSHLHD